MKILITGAAGQLGKELCVQLEQGGSALGPLPERLQSATVIPVDIADADLTDRRQAAALVRRHAPDAVIHCAAYTNVDGAETDPDTAFAVNALAPRNMAMACEEAGAKLIHLSTDYVFNGTGTRPFTEGDLPAPQSVYGSTKLLGEQYVRAFCTRWFIVRTSWLYGRYGNNFVRTMLRLSAERDELTVVNDQHGNPTSAVDLAHHLLKLTPTKEYGLYHCTGNGTCTWYDFTCEIMQQAGRATKITPVSSAAYAAKAGKPVANRPANSALEHTMLRATVGDEMRPWKEALAEFIEAEKRDGNI
ncbi:dTDP-4-dehydrorhamnose reductase [Ruminococcaceae bacterium OttesenSCG-928-D13]|nr:dTDP-4-dehydrorhamnose reductase [Ruminococcaceae bacterium OttesenSCG-928-D13]